MAIGVDAKRNTKRRTQQSRVLRAHGPTPRSQSLWERVAAEIVYTEETSHNDAAWLQKAITAIMSTTKKYKGGGERPYQSTPLLWPSSKYSQVVINQFHFLFPVKELRGSASTLQK